MPSLARAANIESSFMCWADLGLLKETFENARKLEDEKLQVMPRWFLFPD